MPSSKKSWLTRWYKQLNYDIKTILLGQHRSTNSYLATGQLTKSRDPEHKENTYDTEQARHIDANTGRQLASTLSSTQVNKASKRTGATPFFQWLLRKPFEHFGPKSRMPELFQRRDQVYLALEAHQLQWRTTPPVLYHDLLDAAAKVGNIEVRIGYTFKNKLIAIEALKLSGENWPLYFKGSVQRIEHNRRLALVGDRVLGLALCEMWYHTGNSTGEYTAMVLGTQTRAALDLRGRALEFDKALLLSKHSSGPTLNHIAETFEAILGAVYVDSKHNMQAVRDVLTKVGLDDHKFLRIQDQVPEAPKESTTSCNSEERQRRKSAIPDNPKAQASSRSETSELNGQVERRKATKSSAAPESQPEKSKVIDAESVPDSRFTRGEHPSVPVSTQRPTRMRSEKPELPPVPPNQRTTALPQEDLPAATKEQTEKGKTKSHPLGASYVLSHTKAEDKRLNKPSNINPPKSASKVSPTSSNLPSTQPEYPRIAFHGAGFLQARAGRLWENAVKKAKRCKERGTFVDVRNLYLVRLRELRHTWMAEEVKMVRKAAQLKQLIDALGGIPEAKTIEIEHALQAQRTSAASNVAEVGRQDTGSAHAVTRGTRHVLSSSPEVGSNVTTAHQSDVVTDQPLSIAASSYTPENPRSCDLEHHTEHVYRNCANDEDLLNANTSNRDMKNRISDMGRQGLPTTRISDGPAMLYPSSESIVPPSKAEVAFAPKTRGPTAERNATPPERQERELLKQIERDIMDSHNNAWDQDAVPDDNAPKWTARSVKKVEGSELEVQGEVKVGKSTRESLQNDHKPGDDKKVPKSRFQIELERSDPKEKQIKCEDEPEIYESEMERLMANLVLDDSARSHRVTQKISTAQPAFKFSFERPHAAETELPVELSEAQMDNQNDRQPDVGETQASQGSKPTNGEYGEKEFIMPKTDERKSTSLLNESFLPEPEAAKASISNITTKGDSTKKATPMQHKYSSSTQRLRMRRRRRQVRLLPGKRVVLAAVAERFLPNLPTVTKMSKRRAQLRQKLTGFLKVENRIRNPQPEQKTSKETLLSMSETAEHTNTLVVPVERRIHQAERKRLAQQRRRARRATEKQRDASISLAAE